MRTSSHWLHIAYNSHPSLQNEESQKPAAGWLSLTKGVKRKKKEEEEE
jgi:hypothetical protein